MPTSPAAPPAPAAADTGRDPNAAFYQRADALYRCAVECCRQHERLARLVQEGALPAEQRAAQSLVRLADDALADLAVAYEKTACKTHPDGDAPCWHAANGLWMAGREYARRQRTSHLAGRGLGDGASHSSERLGELTLDYDLEASALLLLKQATETYRRARPHVA